MLLLGESVLSLILVPVQNRFLYFVTFVCGMLSVQLLQLIHFSSQEFDPKWHALSRKLRAGRLWLFLSTLYGVSLIAVGVALKTILSKVVCEYDRDKDDYGDKDGYDWDKDYCGTLPPEYLKLLCGSFFATLTTQQVRRTLRRTLHLINCFVLNIGPILCRYLCS